MFNERLYDAMQIKGVDVEDVARVCQVSRATVYHWLSDRTLPNLDNAFKLCKYLDIDIYYCFGAIHKRRSYNEAIS